MGEIDTKSIESVEAALSLFGEKSDQRIRSCRSACNDELEKEKELEGLLKDLANYKIQLKAKNSTHKQALLSLDHYQKTADELLILLRNAEFERDIYINDCEEARMGIVELESKIKEMDEQLSESVKIREQLSHVISELKSTQGQLFNKEAELLAARDAKLEGMAQTELMETALSIEKGKMEELLRHVSELNEMILHLQLAAVDAEKEKSTVLSEKQAEFLLATKLVEETQEELESMKNQLKLMQNLENQFLEKSILIDSLQLELQQANELRNSAEKATSDAINDINQLIIDMELLVRENSDKSGHINSLEIELNQLKLDLKNANEEVDRLNCDVETITGEFEKIKSEVDEISARETEAQVEIALLKSELHKGRSKTAAAEASEERAKSEKSGLHRVIQQLALEAEEAKNESRRLKEAAGKGTEETENFSQDKEDPEIDESKTEDKKRGDETDTHITISVEEYEALVKKVEKADQVPEPIPENRYELEIVKKELEITTVRIGVFRTRAEQAVTRAEAAEMAKAALEEQIKRWREQKERRKAALEALRQESISRKNSFKKDEAPKIYHPLGKILNMKFS